MLDLLLLRTKEGLALLEESQKKRYKSTEIIDKSVELDAAWKESKLSQFNYNNLYRTSKIRHTRNGLQSNPR